MENRLFELNSMVAGLALVPSQTMAKRIKLSVKPIKENQYNWETKTEKKENGKEETYLVSHSGGGQLQFIFEKKKGKPKTVKNRFTGLVENTELIASYLVSYCQRKLIKMRQGKGEAKTIIDGKEQTKRITKSGKPVFRKVPSHYLKGSQAHIQSQNRDISDGLDSVQNALLFWVKSNQKAFLESLDGNDFLTYVRKSREIGKPYFGFGKPDSEWMKKPLTYRILAIGCYQTMRHSRKAFQRVNPVLWKKVHANDHELASLKEDKETVFVDMVESNQTLKGKILALPKVSKTEKRTRRILLALFEGHSLKEISLAIGLPYGYCKSLLSKFRTSKAGKSLKGLAIS